ncbi:hypothetical protein HRbin08_02100 [bacterium HR08]|nr:hypothetical protein HRbin08_02100 [bacterium HR08]
MTERYLLYDSGCSVCAALAREVEALSAGRLGVRSLREPEVQAMLNRAKPGWRWEPMLLEIEGERIRVFTGLAMRMRLLQLLGPARALRVAQAVARFGGPVLGVDWGRRDFLRRALGALAGWITVRGLKSESIFQADRTSAPKTKGYFQIVSTRKSEPAALCWYSWNGRGSYQSACNGCGKCGTWNNTAYQATWPIVTTYSLCDYSGCGQSLLARQCGSTMYVTNRCNGASIGVTVADCGPNMRNYCSAPERCPPGGIVGYEPAITDLTPAAFSAIADLALGTIPMTVRFQATCASGIHSSAGAPPIEPLVPTDLFIQGWVRERTQEGWRVESKGAFWILRIDPNTSIWKGEEGGEALLQPGDFLFGRGWLIAENRLLATRIWLNLVNLYGQVLSCMPWTIDLQSADDQRLHILMDVKTLLDEEPLSTPRASGPLSSHREGDNDGTRA